jgi:hypothetical protein
VSAQVTQRVSVATSGRQGNAQSGSNDWAGVSVSADGGTSRSRAGEQPRSGRYERADGRVRTRPLTGATERVSVDGSGVEANGDSRMPCISGDGSVVAFVSFASNLVPGDTNRRWDVFVHDRGSGTTTRVNLARRGANGRGRRPESTLDHGRRPISRLPELRAQPRGRGRKRSPDIFVFDRFTDTPES